MDSNRIVYTTPKPAHAVQLTEIAVASKAFWGYSDEFMTACHVELEVKATDLSAANRRYRSAVCNDQILGFGCIEKLDATRAELNALFVRPECFRQGIGTTLFRLAKSDALEFYAKALLIQSDPYAVDFYKKHGAKHIGERPSGSIPGRVLPLLAVELTTHTPGTGHHGNS